MGLFIFSIVPGCIWLAVSLVIYSGFLAGVLPRLNDIKLFLLTLVSSTFLSPGIAVGHGIIPFPGGLAFLFGEDSPGNKQDLIFNFAWWAITFISFSIRTSKMKKQGSGE